MKYNLFILILAWIQSSVTGQVLVRLSGIGATSSQGRVEVFHENQWGTVCGDDFDLREVGVVCRSLGFNNGGTAVLNGTFGPGASNMPIWMDNLQCEGDEDSLDMCIFNGWNITDCTHNEDVGVICFTSGVTQAPVLPTTTKASATVQPNNCSATAATPTQGDVRIIGPSNLQGIGFVEVFYNGQWGAVCDDRWGIDDAKVVCRMLCFDPANARAGTEADIEHMKVNVSSNYFLDELQCTGSESKLENCPSNGWNNSDCSGLNEFATISCGDIVQPDPFAPDPIVDCRNGTITTSFSLEDDPFLQIKHLSLMYQPTGVCNLKNRTDANFVTIGIPFYECGTLLTVNDTHIIYNNTIKYDFTQRSGQITRSNIFNVVVFCIFERELNIDEGAIAPQTETVTKKADGKFIIHMSFFLDNSFTNQITNFPINLTLGEWLNIAILLEAVDPNLKIVVPNCRATPSTNANDNINYTLFQNGCKKDETLGFLNWNDTVFAFMYQTFKFISFDEVYIHCEAFVCTVNEKDAQCDQSCQQVTTTLSASPTTTPSTRRRKRDASNSRIVYHVSSPLMTFRTPNASNEIIRGTPTQPMTVTTTTPPPPKPSTLPSSTVGKTPQQSEPALSKTPTASTTKFTTAEPTSSSTSQLFSTNQTALPKTTHEKFTTVVNVVHSTTKIPQEQIVETIQNNKSSNFNLGENIPFNPNIGSSISYAKHFYFYLSIYFVVCFIVCKL